VSPTPPNQPPPGWGPDPQQGGWVPPDQQGGWVPPAQQPPPQPGWQDPNAGWNSAPGYGTPPPGMSGGAPVQKKSSPVVPIVVLVVVLVAAAVAAFLVLGGGDDESGPAAALENYVSAANDQDCAAMVDVIDVDEAGGTRQELLGQCESAFETAQGTDISSFIPEGVESTETISEGENNATLAVQFRMSDGSTEPDEVDFTRIDGDWKIVSSSLSLGDAATPDPTTPTTGAPQSTTTTESTTTTTQGTTTTSADPSTSDPELPFTIGQGTPEQLQPYYDACAGGDMAACDDLWFGAPLGSEQETFAETCGGLDPAGGHARRCEEDYG
jgi:hypothetical protein